MQTQYQNNVPLPFGFYWPVISLWLHLSFYQVKGQCREMKLHCTTNWEAAGEEGEELHAGVLMWKSRLGIDDMIVFTIFT